jgi:hypothetical protein
MAAEIGNREKSGVFRLGLAVIIGHHLISYMQIIV